VDKEQQFGSTPGVEDPTETLNGEETKEFLDRNFYLKKADGFPARMRKEAYRGIAGQIVALITENTELWDEAVLVQFLVAFGNMAGREPYKWAESEHHANEFVCIVGTTANGAKGGSWRAVNSLLYAIDPEYTIKKAGGGFQSAEAIVDSIRDDRERTDSEGETVIDPGEADKRLLIVEEELARIFRVGARKDNQMSEVVRLAWDEPQELYLRGKISPSNATAPHISVIGHITPTDLQATMSNPDTFNGFANRFLWVASQRAKSIPFPKRVKWKDHPEILADIRGALNDFGPNRAMTGVESDDTELTLDRSGIQEFTRIYHDINAKSAKATSVMGALLARAKPHVLRLALIYAMLDRSREITCDHFKAAEAIWDYCVASALWSFGGKTGNHLADKILWLLKRESKGLTRTDINNALRRNVSGQEISEALALLRASGQADFEVTKPKGVTVHRWFACD
jgi:Protein of unknown function (DUF3987)